MHKTYQGEFKTQPTGHKHTTSLKAIWPQSDKVKSDLRAAIEASGLEDGMTISFHHHFRSGDFILNDVMDLLSEMGYRNLELAASSLSTVHDALITHVKSGVIKKIHTSGLRGQLAKAISEGLMAEPVVIRSHGGRARAIEAGDIKIDVAFLGVPTTDDYGNANGYMDGKICGALGYAQVDAKYADHVILLAEEIRPYPNMPAAITQYDVDQVVKVDRIGDPGKIASGATRFTSNPKELLIAKQAAKVIAASRYFKDEFSYQTGSGGSSLAVTRFIEEMMIERNIKASFALGGITGPLVELHEKGLIRHLFDVQSFDLVAAKSLAQNPNHHEIDASLYANPHNKGCMVNKLDFVVLSALEIDKDFNVNVITGSDGRFMGASGGHCDTAAAANVTIIVAPLIRGRIPTVVDKVETIVTPGSSIDVLVTERGIAVNPANQELQAELKKAGVALKSMAELVEAAEAIVGKKKAIEYTDDIVGLIEYRDGSIIDVVKGVRRD